MDVAETTNVVYEFDRQKYMQFIHDGPKPWLSNVEYFKKVRISSLAAMKMVAHCHSGGRKEVMGLMCGKVVGNVMYVIDSFALPVEGTETRVNAAEEANEYSVRFCDSDDAIGKHEPVIGWYHSHPGYGCWLSGIDVETQMNHQTFQDPYLAVVIDPLQTAASGKITLGAFRTYPSNHQSAGTGEVQYQAIPLDKIQEFGVHNARYYPMDVSYFKTETDALVFDNLWKQYWMSTLSSSPLISNSSFFVDQIKTVTDKLDAISQGSSSTLPGPVRVASKPSDTRLGSKAGDRPKGKPLGMSKTDSAPSDAPQSHAMSVKVSQDTLKCSSEILSQIIAQRMKRAVFSNPLPDGDVEQEKLMPSLSDIVAKHLNIDSQFG